MARYATQHFDIKQPLYVRKAFDGNGRMWLPGQLFDWKHFAIAPQRVRALFRASYLRHEEQEDIEEAAATVEPVAHDDGIEELATEEETAHEYTIEHKAGPYYDVIAPDGTKYNDKALHKSKAQELADELNGKTPDENTDLPSGVATE